MSSLRIVVTGLIAQYPLGGVTWDYIQYPAGLAALGHDVYYIEDMGQWPYNPLEGGVSRSCDFNVSYLAAAMAQFGLTDRWAYRFPWRSQWYGLADRQREDIINTADLVINVSGTLQSPEKYRGRGRLVYIDTDPVFTQIKLLRQQHFKSLIDLHDSTFSFGEDLSRGLLDTGHAWQPTRQPVLVSEWSHQLPYREAFTTVMTWKSYKPIVFSDQLFGQKDLEFKRFLDLPALVKSETLEIALSKAPFDLLRHKGWLVVDPNEVCPDPNSYRSYLQGSKGEWSIAKNGYVTGRSGWFSCRSACYLASGRPVVVQDTGFKDRLPVGEGLLAFADPQEAAEGIFEVGGSYERHSEAATAIANEYFDARRVLGDLLERALVPTVTVPRSSTS